MMLKSKGFSLYCLYGIRKNISYSRQSTYSLFCIFLYKIKKQYTIREILQNKIHHTKIYSLITKIYNEKVITKSYVIPKYPSITDCEESIMLLRRCHVDLLSFQAKWQQHAIFPILGCYQQTHIKSFPMVKCVLIRFGDLQYT